MLDLHAKLVFPRLVPVGREIWTKARIKEDAEEEERRDLIPPDGDDGSEDAPVKSRAVRYPLFRLDWDGHEKRLDADRQMRIDKSDPDLVGEWGKHPMEPSLPEPLDSIVKATTFHLKGNYRDEVRRNAKCALWEWNHKRTFDTFVRGFCLETAHAHIWVAFRLLADCVWDEMMHSFSREEWKYYCVHAMVFKFWCHQTGDGLLCENARIDKLEKVIKQLRSPEGQSMSANWENEADEREKFVKTLEEHQHVLCNPPWRDDEEGEELRVTEGNVKAPIGFAG